jgi:hypothetical protein
MKIRSVLTEFHAGRHTVTGDMTPLVATFRNFTNRPKNAKYLLIFLLILL